jgi:hypothetical protein
MGGVRLTDSYYEPPDDPSEYMDEEYEYDEGWDVDRKIDEMKEEGRWPLSER